MPQGWGPPPIDFSQLGNIVDKYQQSQKWGDERRLKNNRAQVLSNLPRGADGAVDYSEAVRRLIGSNDLAGAGAMAEIQKSLSSGGITPSVAETMRHNRVMESDASQRAGQPKIGGTTERIRDKLARGEPLNPGEKKVYEDALRGDP